MGYYINRDDNLKLLTSPKDVALLKTGQFEAIPAPEDFGEIPPNKALVCVVKNGGFDAAAYCFNADELRAFQDLDDPRPKVWLLGDKKLIQRLSGFTRGED